MRATVQREHLAISRHCFVGASRFVEETRQCEQ
jgi:hypothetical protein